MATVCSADSSEFFASALSLAYPEAAISFESFAEGQFILVEGKNILFRPKGACPKADTHSGQDQPVCSMFDQVYPKGADGRNPAVGFDPGRVRNEILFKALYGETEEAVKKNCVPVEFMGRKVLFNSKHGAASALLRVAARLETLAASEPKVLAYIQPPGGTLAFKKIAGTTRLSAHSFGIAIDLNVQKGPYWKWLSRKDKKFQAAKDNYPQSIVDAFEAEGFIWGGKWYSFDFMHFEYRPELITDGSR